MPEYKLMYFDGRGRAEVSRLVFAAAGQKYEDQRYNQDTWPTVKGKTPCGQLPCLVVDGKMYCQSIPIAVFLASTFGFHGKTPAECLQVNQVMATAADLGEALAKIAFEKDAAKKEELINKMKTDTMPNTLKVLEKQLTDNGGQYYCLNKLTLADIMVFCVLDKPVSKHPELLKAVPKVSANFERVKNQEGIKKYLSTRKDSEW